MTGAPEVRLKGGPRSGEGFTAADFRMQILAALRMGRRTPEGPGWALGYRPSGNGSEWIWADGAVCHSPAQFDPELLRPYGAHLRDAAAAGLAEAS
ncbi:hypothetical protein AB0H36_27850 [Kribbella sp. NPDC050820]|uniref:hypothetical protein n=1 Tax=Kribbella sp. NPDC050820 TaxID=3155408 RepID=UPI0034045FAC